MAELSTPEGVREQVRKRYAEAARTTLAGAGNGCCGAEPAAGCGCGTRDGEEPHGEFGATLYTRAERDSIPEQAAGASLGCGNPTAVADLRPGDTVLDLGSGGGIDVLLSARRVGPTGFAYGLDMTEEMLELARANQRRAGVANAAFLKGTIEAIPLPADSVDVIVSNCVINLSADKTMVLQEAARVLRPGGRLAVTDIIANDGMEAATREDMEAWTGCIAGALTAADFRAGLAAAGFEQIEIRHTHRVHDQAWSAIVRARLPRAR